MQKRTSLITLSVATLFLMGLPLYGYVCKEHLNQY
jgi:hypothetical protein